MRFTSLVVELIRARPRLVVWLVVLVQAGLWLILPMLLYRSPPGDVATVLAFGREYQVGTWLGPPLAFWLADIAFRAAGNTMFGVYLLAQACAVVTFWIYYQLARAIVGGQQAVLAVLLSLTVVAFSSPGVEFGPLVLARPLWALLLLHSWQLIGQNRRNAWFAWSIEAGLLLLTTSAAPVLLLLLAGFAVATERGRRVLTSLDPLYALLVIVVLVLPYLIWLLRADALAMPPWPAISDLGARAMHWGWLLGGLVLAASAIVLLVILNSGWFARNAAEAPIIYRPPVDPLARDFVYFFAVAPALLGSFLTRAVQSRPHRRRCRRRLADVGARRDRGDRRSALPAASARCCARCGRRRSSRLPWRSIATIAFLPWTGIERSADLAAGQSDRAFFGDNFERRTNQRLRAVAGDPQLASFIAMSRGRPHLLLDATPERTPWLSVAKFNETGGVVVWRASDTSGTPPPEIAQRFPGLVPEVPRAFEWMVNGRQPLLRIGWAIVRPKAP